MDAGFPLFSFFLEPLLTLALGFFLQASHVDFGRPQGTQLFEELVVVHVAVGDTIWKVAVEHLRKEIVSDAKHDVQVGPNRLSRDVLPHLSLVLCEILVAFVEINVAERIEYSPCIRQEVLVDLCLCLAKTVVLVIEPFE